MKKIPYSKEMWFGQGAGSPTFNFKEIERKLKISKIFNLELSED